MNLQFLVFCVLPVCLVNAEIGLLLIKTSAGSKQIEKCAGFNAGANSEGADVPWDSWHKITNEYPNHGCSELGNDYLQKYALLKRGNCSFAKKLSLAVGANGRGIVVVSSTIDVPYLDPNSTGNLTNKTVALINEDTFNKLVSLQDEYGNDSVRILEYLPKPLNGIDPNIIVMFFIAVTTLGLGAWLQGIITLSSIKKTPTQSAPMPSGHNSSQNQNANDFSLTPAQAFVFFLMCSVSILLLYFFYDYLVYVVIGIFCYASALSLFDLLYNTLNQWPAFVRLRIPRNNLPLLKKRPPVFGILLFVGCASISIVWAVFRKASFAWFLQDILGSAFCIFMIKSIRISSFKISTVFLGLFFLYDIFYVFITKYFTTNEKSIMVAIATGEAGTSNEELPMLLKIPKFIPSVLAQCVGNSYSLLGFGDIILPGLHIGFCASFDVITSMQKSVKSHAYYVTGLIAYSVGLILTFVVVNVTKVGQPALFYLVPCCLLTTFLVAVKKEELYHVWLGKPNSKVVEESHNLLAMTH